MTSTNHKGYGIPRTTIDEETFKKTKEELTVKPFMLPDFDTDNEPFPVYRLTNLRLYVPKFYGIEKFGKPQTVSDREGEDISLVFKGSLRKDQEEFIKKVSEHIEKEDSCIGCAQTGQGKCLGFNTPIMMHDGSVKMVQNIKVGDLLMGDDSTPRKVLSLARGIDEMYEIKPSKGESYVVNREHILSLKKRNGEIVDIPLLEFEETTPLEKSFKNLSIEDNTLYGYRVPIDFPEQDTPTDPYVFGSCIEEINSITESPNSFMGIQKIYKYNSRNNRIKLLKGILQDRMVYYTEFKNLAYDIEYIARSVGIFSYVVWRKDGFEVRLEDTNTNTATHTQHTNNALYDFKIIPIGKGNYYGFEIDGNRRFVLGDFSVTHNTVIALNILSKFQKKTLIIVHKEFLLNQWKERIEQFLRSKDNTQVKVGTIRQSKVEIEGYQIVIGMLQSISMKEYPIETFDSFGFVIVDETHHICSKTFSKALYKIGTKKMLGLSATPQRKDGLTKVLNWFLGPILYKESENNSGDKILTPIVKIVQAKYLNNGANIVPKYVKNYGGGPDRLNTADLITQLSLDPIRNKQIANEILEQLKDSRKIIVLADRRQHCFDIKLLLEKAQKEQGVMPFTVGLYIGAMKNDQLEESNTCDVILATYQIASEGYDNPKLDTLIFASSKTDIEQSCGRILRKKNKNPPLFIDIADTQFRYGQIKARKAYYKKKGYTILENGKPMKSVKEEEKTFSGSDFIDD